MPAKLDRARSYTEVTGPGRTHSYEQDNKCFDASGDEISKADMLDRLQAAVPAGSDAQVAQLKDQLAAANARADEITKERDNLKNLLESATQSDNTARMADLEAQIRQKDGEIAAAQETIAKQQQELDQSFDALKAVADKQATKTEVVPTSVPSTEPTPTPEPVAPDPTSPAPAGETAPAVGVPPEVPAESPATPDAPPADSPSSENPTP